MSTPGSVVPPHPVLRVQDALLLDRLPPGVGDELVRLVQWGAEHGAPAWWLDAGLDGAPLVVPRPRRELLHEQTRTWAEDVSWRQARGGHRVGDRLMLVLATAAPTAAPAHLLAWQRLTPNDLSAFRKLIAAAEVDLRGTPRAQIAEHFGWDEYSGAVGKKVRDGRRLLANLGAWPWAYLPSPHAPTEGWPEHEHLARALRGWLCDADRAPSTNSSTNREPGGVI